MTGALSLLAGVLAGLLSADIPGVLWQVAAAGLLSWWLLSSGRHRWSSACAGILLGQLLAFAQAQHWLDRRLPDPQAGESAAPRVLAVGLIDSVPSRHGATLRFDLRTEWLEGASAPGMSRLLRIQWHDPRVSPRVGERWRLLLRQVPLEETRNFSGPDSPRLAFRQGVHGAGRVLPSAMNELLTLAPASLNTVRARIALRIRESIADPDAAALVTALAVGLTAGMSRDQWRVFNATGTTHLVAISGLHVTLFAWLMFRMARWLWRRLPGAGGMAREPFALLLGLAAAGGYSLLAGLSVPTQRTWLMLALYVGARLMARRVGAGRLWAMALVLVLLTDVRAPLAAGFWLSFIAVGVLLAFADSPRADSPRADSPRADTPRADAPSADVPREETAGSRAWSVVRLQVVIMLALMPATLAISGGVSLVGLAVNLVAIPLISLVFVPLVLAGALLAWLAPAWDGAAFALAARLYEWSWPVLAWCADLGEGPLAGPRWAPPAWWLLCAVPASLVWLCRWPWPLRLTAVCALLPLAFAPARAGDLASIDVLDAGRGTAVLVRTRHHTLLFDTGDSWNTHGTRLAEIVLPALEAARVRRVDLLVLPALDEDRARASALLAAEIELAAIAAGEDWLASRLPAARCHDSRWRWDGVDFTTMAVGGGCLLKLAAGGHSLLIPGELDSAGERALLARMPAGELASEVVLVGRRTGERASSPQWIETLAPGLAIATGGIEGAQSRRNVVERWRRRARVLDTRRDGAVQLRLDARGVAVLAVARTSRFPFHWRRSGDG